MSANGYLVQSANNSRQDVPSQECTVFLKAEGFGTPYVPIAKCADHYHITIAHNMQQDHSFQLSAKRVDQAILSMIQG